MYKGKGIVVLVLN